MKKKPSSPPLPRWYLPPDIPMAVIRRFARTVAERFDPEKIILFGSFAKGTPHEGSDVDILVVMPARNEVDQSVRILHACGHNFPLDLIVRTPKNLEQRLKDEDWFLREVIATGKVLYEKTDGGVGRKGRGPRRPIQDANPRRRLPHKPMLPRE